MTGGVDFDDSEIIADYTRGVVTYRHSIMAEAPDNKDQTKQNLMNALNNIKSSAELLRVVVSTKRLVDVVEAAKSKIDKILLVNYIPGRCDVCRRLGL